MRCDECQHWTKVRLTRYGDGAEIVNWRAADGWGECDKLSINTEADFGCVKFWQSDSDHVVVARKPLAPWQYSQRVPCPDCDGRGSAADPSSTPCRRCGGTGKVYCYDDGHIGDITPLHPRERELQARERQKCVSCSRELDPIWVTCPWCGTRTDKPGELEVVALQLNQQGTTDEMVTKMREKRARDAMLVGGDVLRPQEGA